MMVEGKKVAGRSGVTNCRLAIMTDWVTSLNFPFRANSDEKRRDGLAGMSGHFAIYLILPVHL